MVYRMLDHATDAIVDLEAQSLDEAFSEAGRAAAEITLDTASVKNTERRRISVSAQNLHHLLYGWLEDVIYLMITDGFAISTIRAKVSQDGQYHIEAEASGEPLDLKRHGFKVEIKAPTFHDMVISISNPVRMRFLLDL